MMLPHIKQVQLAKSKVAFIVKHPQEMHGVCYHG